MSLSKRYEPATLEPSLQAAWERDGTYHYRADSAAPVFSIDTPPPTVSGLLHLGHTYSYTHADIIARYRRMRGDNVFYPMGYDDNGLPTERLVERRLGSSAARIGRRSFVEQCLAISEASEREYEALWRRLGLSIDWRYTYRTVDARSRRLAQRSFLDLYRRERAYRRRAPAIWCPECQTAIAQAEVNDLERESRFYTLAFELEGGERLPIATTRPELLPACVAVFVHPDDQRYAALIGRQVRLPLLERQVPLLADTGADPRKGTGAVMCCTFGDAADVQWWQTHSLPLIELIGRDGRLTAAGGPYAGLALAEARRRIVEALHEGGALLNTAPLAQSVRVHERCDTPVEYLLTQQWFVRVLDFKQELLAAGEQIRWHPAHMATRYRQWVENLAWDWSISRQRVFGVPFPLWYCAACDAVQPAGEQQLPIDPLEQQPEQPCGCGSSEFVAEADVMDTWATSSLTPAILAELRGVEFDATARLLPMSLRCQGHEIIRTWAFYTILKSLRHYEALPWREVFISGWGLAPDGAKISKSRGGGPMAPLEMIERYSADAVRYWAASTGPGKDSLISEEKIRIGAKLITKLWNVARFAERFIAGYMPPDRPPALPPTDRWILSRLQRLISRVSDLLDDYEYAAAKSEIESFFWVELADNYLELVKQRLYNADDPAHEAARFTLQRLLLTLIKLLAPFLPHVSEAIFQGLFGGEGSSIHRSRWPEAEPALLDPAAEKLGLALLEVAAAVRRYKSESGLALGAELDRLELAGDNRELLSGLEQAAVDLMSVTRARQVFVAGSLGSGGLVLRDDPGLAVAIGR